LSIHDREKIASSWHGRCERVVTKETFTQELPQLLTEGITA